MGDHFAASRYFIKRGCSYLAVDAPREAERREHVLGIDLNRTFDIGQFDIVTNFGTSEHVFNQAAVFESIHNACRVGGYMVHAVPCAMRWHGLFGYTDKFFTELARANGYEVRGQGTDIDVDADRNGPMVAVCFKRVTGDAFAFPYDYGLGAV